MGEEYGAMPTMLCCVCGMEITPNPANMCVACLRNEVDITSIIPTQLTMHSCRGCQRFLLPPWMKVDLESKELMSACLRKIPGLSKVKVVDAVWIWTEPHSLRLKIKLTIQKEVLNGAILQQAKIVEFVIRNQQCKTCQSFYAQGVWHAVVQVRQHVPHKRTFFYLEQVLLKYNAHSDCLQITTFKDGMDFYFMDKQQALRFIDFLEGKVPIQTKYSRKLMTADHKSNIGKFKHNFIVTISTVCKDDLTLLPRDLARNLSNISPLVLVKAISSGITVVDPFTGEKQDLNTEKYFRDPFGAVMTSRQLMTFIVLAVEAVLVESRPTARKRGTDRKMRMAEVVVAREKDFGVNDLQYTVMSHLGHLLREGDLVQGYDMTTATWTGEELDRYKDSRKGDLPDIILVRKYYTAKKDRMYDLKPLDFDEQEFPSSNRENQNMESDYELFLQELDGDKEMRSHVNLYKANSKKASSALSEKERNLQLLRGRKASRGESKRGAAEEEEDMEQGEDDEELEEDEEEVRLEELLDGLDLAMNDSVSDATAAAVMSEEQVILTVEEAALVPSLPLETSEFDVSQYDPKDYKFI